MKLVLFATSLLLSPVIMAQTAQIQEIQNSFNQLKDLNRADSFKAILGKKYSCTEIVHNPYQNKYDTYTTELSFDSKMSNYYGNSTVPDYLQYTNFERTNAEKFAKVPHFGCDGIEWGVAYLTESPYLHMSNLYSQVGNSNLGPCYDLKFRVQSNGNLVALGVYKDKPVHLLKCLKK